MSGFKDNNINTLMAKNNTKTLASANDEDDWTSPGSPTNPTAATTSSGGTGQNWRDEKPDDWLAKKRESKDTTPASPAVETSASQQQQQPDWLAQKRLATSTSQEKIHASATSPVKPMA